MAALVDGIEAISRPFYCGGVFWNVCNRRESYSEPTSTRVILGHGGLMCWPALLSDSKWLLAVDPVIVFMLKSWYF